jgi:hypothetical protein
MDCKELNIEIENLTHTIATNEILAINNGSLRTKIDQDKKRLTALKLDFDTYGCIVLLEKERQKELVTIKEKYSGLDEERITTESTYQRNKKVLFAGIVLLSALAIMLAVKKK